MQPNASPDMHTWAGTAGGILLIILMQVHASDMYRTAVLAAIGGGVSFAVSLALKYLVRFLKKH